MADITLLQLGLYLLPILLLIVGFAKKISIIILAAGAWIIINSFLYGFPTWFVILNMLFGIGVAFMGGMGEMR